MALNSRVLGKLLTIGLTGWLFALATLGLVVPAYSRPSLQTTPAPGPRVYLPLVSRNYPNTEWSQHAHDAQRTSFTPQSVPTPWRWKWAWNGPNSTGGISSGKFGLPRNSQPVMGDGRVYLAAGSRGVYALNQTNGAVAWNRNPGGSINSTPGYDGDTNAVFVVASNGTLYKLDAASGATLGQFASGASSALPLPPAILSDRVLFSMGNRVYAVGKQTLNQLWSYDAGAPVHTPPAYSPSRNRVIAVSSDLFVHAIENTSGARAWRVKPTVRSGGDPGGTNSAVAEVSYGWPVIAEIHGYVLIKLRLDWQALWIWNPWPTDNATMRQNLQARPEYQSLMVLDLDDGRQPFSANVGHGGFGDGGYLPMGPQPVVKRLSNGQEIVYTTIRGDSRSGIDGRGDSHPGEMVLDDTTVPGLLAGYVRWIDDRGFTNSSGFFPTDEQPNASMAGDQLFFAHWEAGSVYQITDRSSSRGSYQSRISTSLVSAIVTSQDNLSCVFTLNHYCLNGLVNTRSYPPGFYIYYRQGAVYDQYWREYAVWVISNGLILFASTDGAVVALEPGSPTGQSMPDSWSAGSEFPAVDGWIQDETETTVRYPRIVVRNDAGAQSVISYTQAANFAGQFQTVEGVIQFVFNNRKAVYLGFQNPHQGAFKVRIMSDAWDRFSAPPESLYAVNQQVRVTGLIEWYQGDPVIYVSDPAQIEVVEGAR